MRQSGSAALVAFLGLVLTSPVAAQDGSSKLPDLSDAEKLYGLSLIWQEANYNFAFFDQVPDLDWDSAYRAFVPRVLETRSTYEYYRQLQRLVALLQDGHSGVSLPDPDRAFLSYPWVLTHNVEGRVLVANVGRTLEKRIPVGSVIETIDGEPAAKRTLEVWLPYISSSTDHHREDRALAQALYGPPEESVTIVYVRPDGERREATLARDRGTRDDEWLLPTRSTRPRFEFRWLDDDIAYVALNTFNDEDVVTDFEAALPELYGARALIVDVRRNGGGSSGHGYSIAAYLTDDTLHTSAWRTREHVAAYKAWGRWSDQYKEYHEMSAWRDGGTHGGVAPVEGRRLIVPTVVLQEHETFSAAEDFLVAIDAIPHITTLGRPSGGSTGQPLLVELPGGGRAQICTKRDSYPDGREFVGYGIMPDIVVEPTIADVQAGRDAQLERAVELLRGELGSP